MPNEAGIDARSPIGVFDSGVGGLTVLAALCARLPRERFVYLGDTARLPYGTKSPDTVVRYALQAADALVRRGVKALVIACNTASAVALPAMAERYGPLPLLGVVEPGAAAAAAATRSGQIAVIGTEATVRGGAYQRAICRRRPDAQIRAVACQLFVALAEEGWIDGPVARASAERYLSGLCDTSGTSGFVADTLVLGCTHFPMLRATIREVIGEHVCLVDSAATTAEATQGLLQAQGLLAPAAPTGARVQLLATDGVERFALVGTRFLGRPIAPAEVELVDL
ncbi:MAG TPA: glutamate racemase [Steroidobacteraceae bacterium]|nr:glutamate racemase [Steroidobacteraceae bacterium]